MDLSLNAEDWICPICLEEILGEHDLTFLKPCFHHFCLDCVKHWFISSKGTVCPLCKRVSSALITDIQSSKVYHQISLQNEDWKSAESHTDSIPLILRRLLYSGDLTVHPKSVFPNISMNAFVLGHRDLDRLDLWLDRELQAVFHSQSNEMVKRVVLNCFRTKLLEEALLQVKKTCKDFFDDDLDTFVLHLDFFCRSKLSLSAYDRRWMTFLQSNKY